MNEAKLNFLKVEFIPVIKELEAGTQPAWGRMNAQQMVEHVADFFKVSTNKFHFELVTPAEHLPKYKEFLLSEKEFRENTKAPMLPDEPFPLRNASLEEALKELEIEVNAFFHYFSGNQSSTLHPVFGELNFIEWVQLHHKHVKHHLKQFGITVL
jgi:hypothetical protein